MSARLPTDFDSLWNAWVMVRSRSGCPGVDGISVREFAANARPRVLRLADDIAARRYRPYPLRQFTVPKNDGGVRVLTIPTVRDRIVQRAALTALEPALESTFLASSYAYRTGRSVRQAVQSVSALHGAGYEWVVHLDVRECFDSIDWAILFEKLKPLADPYLRLLIRKWVEAPRIGGPMEPPGMGIPQGGVISPSLCNLVLNDMDLELHRLGIPEVRYADDCLLFARSEKKARIAMLAAADILNTLKLEPNLEKTEIVTFDGGFRFLGTLFVRSIVLPCIRIKTSSGKTRYVSGYDVPSGRRAGHRKVQVSRERGHIAVEGPMSDRELQRLVAKAIVDETEGRSTALGRALLKAWRAELSRAVSQKPQSRDRRATVALLA